MVWQGLDLLEYICKAGLLLYLLQNVIQVKDKYGTLWRQQGEQRQQYREAVHSLCH